MGGAGSFPRVSQQSIPMIIWKPVKQRAGFHGSESAGLPEPERPIAGWSYPSSLWRVPWNSHPNVPPVLGLHISEQFVFYINPFSRNNIKEIGGWVMLFLCHQVLVETYM